MYALLLKTTTEKERIETCFPRLMQQALDESVQRVLAYFTLVEMKNVLINSQTSEFKCPKLLRKTDAPS